ncbi:exosortase F system-associated membrane protein [Flavobacterium sp.]|jgi:exosortase F-associated protein|uniref:exosortase F system-associated membrane protein n=1 Tax=Flavobacterium sp. TaxID=239 RepID=UPI0037BF2440
MDSKIKYFAIAGFIAILVLIRIYESNLFYDPFLEFFNDATQNKTIPKYDGFKLFFGLLFRYLINSICTVFIIYLLFKETNLVKLASFLLLAFFVILTILFFFLLEFSANSDVLILFYVRRFLIQPLFLILFVPAFYYQKSVNKQ